MQVFQNGKETAIAVGIVGIIGIVASVIIYYHPAEERTPQLVPQAITAPVTQADLSVFTPEQLKIILNNCDMVFSGAEISDGDYGVYDAGSNKKICYINGTEITRNRINVFTASSTRPTF